MADTSADGTAAVTTGADTGAKTLKVTGSANLNGMSYAVIGFAPNALNGVESKNIAIDLKASRNT